MEQSVARHILENLERKCDIDYCGLCQIEVERLILTAVKEQEDFLEQERKFHDQAIILGKIQESGFNVVTCGNCGKVLIHEIEVGVITCPHCDNESEPCDFPDLFY